MKRKYFKCEHGEMFYDHYTGTDLFDVKLFPLKNDKQWKDIIGTSGQNAEREAKSIATTVFNYTMKLIVEELIAKNCYIPLGIFGMGYIAKAVVETEKLSPQTMNKKAVICVRLSNKFKKLMDKWYKARLTRPGRAKLYNVVKVK